MSHRYAQLRQVVGRLAMKTLVCHPAELVRDPICHIEPVQLSVKELCQTAVILPCAAYSSRCSIHDALIILANRRMQLTLQKIRYITHLNAHQLLRKTSLITIFSFDNHLTVATAGQGVVLSRLYL